MTQSIRRIKGSSRTEELTNNIMDSMHRPQLDAFISRLFNEIEVQKGIRYDDLLACYKNMIVPSNVDEAINCDQHIELEYIRFQNCEYLYHRMTSAVYTFDTVKPKHIGYYDVENDALKLI
jgi:hypothetical protein